MKLLTGLLWGIGLSYLIRYPLTYGQVAILFGCGIILMARTRAKDADNDH